MDVEEKEEDENDDNDEPKWNIGDYVVLEDSRIGSDSKVFWEILAVVKSREFVCGEWQYCIDDMDYDSSYLYRHVPERRLKESKYSRRIQNGIRNNAEERATREKLQSMKMKKKRSKETEVKA